MPYSTHPCPDCSKPVSNRYTRCNACNGAFMKGANNPAWKGGITKDRYHYKKIQVQRYPERNHARACVQYAVKTGKLVKSGCQWPGCTVGPDHTQFHHWSYEPGRELDVTEFCRDHHEQVKDLSKEQFQFIASAGFPLSCSQAIVQGRLL